MRKRYLPISIIVSLVVIGVCSQLIICPATRSDEGRGEVAVSGDTPPRGPRPAAPVGAADTTIAGTARFGVQGALTRYPAEMRDAGIEIAREWIDWQELEPVRGRYNWGPLDRKVSAAGEAGIAILGYFINMPAWAKRDPRARGDFRAPADIADFRRLARDVAARYDGRHGHGELRFFEILNEVTVPDFYDFKDPDNPYELWLVNGYQGIKEGNPNAEALIGGFFDPLDRAGHPPRPAVREFIERMVRDYAGSYDIMNVHSYSEDAAGLTRTVRWLQGVMREHGNRKPLWITETSTLYGIRPVYDQERQAGELIKRYVRAFSAGVETVFWFPFVGLPTPQDDPEHGSKVKYIGLGWDYPKRAGMEHSYHPLPSHAAYRVMAAKLRGFSAVEPLAESQYRFLFPDRNPVYVLWRDDDSLPLPAGLTGSVTVTDDRGNAETRDAAEVVLTGNPVFLE